MLPNPGQQVICIITLCDRHIDLASNDCIHHPLCFCSEMRNEITTRQDYGSHKLPSWVSLIRNVFDRIAHMNRVHP